MSSGEEPRPSYSNTRERIVRVVPPHLICSLTCGGRECRYEGPECWSVEQQAIPGLYSSWITDEILAMSRPSTRLIQEYKITEQFHRFGIRSVVNAQIPLEHGYCGDPLDPQSGFSYRPQDFMDSGICFYNFGLPDFGVAPVPRILDAVKVIAFALREGRVAVHCHAGLGRTGVLIACYLIYACRISAADSIRFVRLRRPGSIQTGSQVSLVCDFALFLSSQWPVFPQAPLGYSSFNLAQYLAQQRNLLHGQEARALRYLPKPVIVICRRLAQLAGGRRARGPWVELEREAANRLLRQVIVRAANDRHCKKMPTPNCETEDNEQERTGKKRRGFLQSQISCDTGILQLLLMGGTSVDMASNGLRQLDLSKTATFTGDNNVPGEMQKGTNINTPLTDNIIEPCQPVTPHHVLCIAEALAELQAPESVIHQSVQQLQNLVNEEGAWAAVSTESNPKILCTLLWDWLQQLSEPVLNQQDINLFCDGDWRNNLTKLSRQPPDMPHLPPALLLQLRSIVQEIRAHGIMSRAHRKATDTAQYGHKNTDKNEGKSSS
ncbi:protein tyrosine phosphatase domain-containing protein 1-like isoform X2 [Pyxicephalus adspersus]|uniref:protein tyrosine phosphatase domain-containing protein 1-like isoform X2 n=1 Tax=Pyxicephalus adspersus TaxID=30357 RepID=UPI003B5B9D9A